MIKCILSVVALLVLSTSLSAQALVLELSPANGGLNSYAGATVGWGYTVTNDSSDWVVLTSSGFSPLPSWGSYEDFFLTNLAKYVQLAPEGSWTESLNALPHTGIGSFRIDPSANPGDTATGYIAITFDRYDGDPSNGGNYIVPGSALASASVTVDAVPEPSTFLLLGGGLVGLFWTRRKSLAKV